METPTVKLITDPDRFRLGPVPYEHTAQYYLDNPDAIQQLCPPGKQPTDGKLRGIRVSYQGHRRGVRD